MSAEILQFEDEIAIIKNKISNLRKKQVQIQKQIEKQEDNDVYDESLYTELDKIDDEIANLEVDIFRINEEWVE
jgi:predicted  nucleic acid-binding Zn-ribbon protein